MTGIVGGAVERKGVGRGRAKGGENKESGEGDEVDEF